MTVHRPTFSSQVVVRMVADAVMINVSLLLALLGRYFWAVNVQHQAAADIFSRYAHAYGRGFLLLTALSLLVFLLSGLYNRTRGYRARYKALRILQGVSIGYLVYAALQAVFPNAALPLSALALAWGITVVMLIGARLWSAMWKSFALAERTLLPHTAERPIKRVLLIGGAGYIGSALLPKLLDKGYQVRLMDMLLFGEEPIAECLGHPNLEVMKADYRQVDKLVEATKGVDALIHLGGIVGDPACALNEELTTEVNLTFTRVIAEVAKGSGVGRFIFASSCSVYGASNEVLDENSRFNPVSLYARSKIASEQVLLEMADEHFSPVLLRFGTIYGLSGRTRFDLVVNLLTAKALFEGKITVFGGDQWRPFVHVDDAALALAKVLEAPLMVVKNQAFNVGSNEQNYTLGQVGKLVQRLVPTAEYIDSGADGDRRNYRVDFAKIRNALGFEPQWTLERGINQVIGAIRAGRVADYRETRYNNYKFLSEGSAPRFTRVKEVWAHRRIHQDIDELNKPVRPHPTPKPQAQPGSSPASAPGASLEVIRQGRKKRARSEV